MIDYTEMRLYQINYQNGFSHESIVTMLQSNINLYFTEEFYEKNINLEYLFSNHNENSSNICSIVLLSTILGYKEYYLSSIIAKYISIIVRDDKFSCIIKFDIIKKAMQIYCANSSLRDSIFVSLLYKISQYIDIENLEITLSEYLALRTNIYITNIKKLTIITDKIIKMNKADFSRFKNLEELKLSHTGFEIILPDNIKKAYIYNSVTQLSLLNIKNTKLTHLIAHNCGIVGELYSFSEILELDITNSCLSLPVKIVKLDITNLNIKKLICNNQIIGFENHHTLEYLDVKYVFPESRKISMNSLIIKELRLDGINVAAINTPNLEKLVLNKIYIDVLILPKLTELYMTESKCISFYTPMVNTLSISENIDTDIFYKTKIIGISKPSDNTWNIFNSNIKKQIEKLYINIHKGTLDLTEFTSLKELYVKHADSIILNYNIKINVTECSYLLTENEKNMTINYVL